MDAQNAPTAPWKTAQNAVSHSYHRHSHRKPNCYPCSRLTLLPIFPVAHSEGASSQAIEKIDTSKLEYDATAEPPTRSRGGERARGAAAASRDVATRPTGRQPSGCSGAAPAGDRRQAK